MENRIGIVGGGQLGRMLTQAAHALGFTVLVLDPTPYSPAGQLADGQIVAHFTDEAAIRKLAKAVDYLTFETELAGDGVLLDLTKDGIKVNPSAKTLNIIKDKLKQKEFLRLCGIPTAEFLPVKNEQEILEAAQKFGYPLMLKARFDAYDGKGNFLITAENDIKAGLEKLHPKSLYVEKLVNFVKEVSVVAARGSGGQIEVYPVVETIHKDSILNMLIAPARTGDEIKVKAEILAKKVMENLEGIGVFGIEMFVDQNKEVLINEIAPRVHNSGHHTIEATKTSQFEQHIRAITGKKLGPTKLTSNAAVMINILGERSGKAEVKGVEEASKIPGVFVHIYGKMEVRPQRKMGHITALASSFEEALDNAEKAKQLISI